MRRHYTLKHAAEKQAQKIANKRRETVSVYGYKTGDEYRVVRPIEKAPQKQYGWERIAVVSPEG